MLAEQVIHEKRFPVIKRNPDLNQFLALTFELKVFTSTKYLILRIHDVTSSNGQNHSFQAFGQEYSYGYGMGMSRSCGRKVLCSCLRRVSGCCRLLSAVVIFRTYAGDPKLR